MGIIRSLRSAARTARALSDAVQASVPEQATAPAAAPPVIDPTPQAEVDALLAGSGPVRAVVLGAHDQMSDGDRPVRTRVTVRLRVRLADGALGPEQTLGAWVGWKVAALLEPGLEIPVELDRATGRVTGIATKQLAQELGPRSTEARRRHRSGTFDLDLDGLRSAPALARDLLTPSPPPPPPPGLPATDPAMVPVAGVTWAQYVAVRAHLVVHPRPDGFEDLAVQLGLPPGRWAEAHAGWTARITSYPALANQWGWDMDREVRRLRGTR